MASKLGHDTKKERTEDVLILEDIDFAGMLLPENILLGLSANGFKRPSPIQLKAIPLGRCGFDLVLEAKSGTGKTCVFSIIALEMVSTEKKKLQVLIIVPTREIALQVADVIRCIGTGVEGLKVHSFIGGTPFEEDKKKLKACHIAVGAPGRVRHLMEKGFMKADRIRLCVLDEADKLMESSFIKDIKYFFSVLPANKQVVVASATMPGELDDILNRHMKSPVRICPHGEGVAPILFGLRQVAVKVPEHPNVQHQLNLKVYALTKLLSTVSFQQCIVFSNYLTRAEGICHELERRGWPCRHTAGILDQSQRTEAFLALIESRCRVLLSTDLTARGVDAPRVDLVVSLDLPNNGPTYLHRIGRAGRFGSYGLAVTLVADGAEMCKFTQMLRSVGANAYVVTPEEFPADLWNCDLTQYVCIGASENQGRLAGDNLYKPPKAKEESSSGSVLNQSSGSKEQKVKNCVSWVNRLVTEDSSSFRGDTKTNDHQLSSDSIATDLDKLSQVIVTAGGECGNVKSFKAVVDSCASNGTLLENDCSVVKSGPECPDEFAESFDRVLDCVYSQSATSFRERLEKCKLADLNVSLKALSIGDPWPPPPPPPPPPPEAPEVKDYPHPSIPKGPVTEASASKNHASWNMDACDVSLFTKSVGRNEKSKKVSDSENKAKPRKVGRRISRHYNDSVSSESSVDENVQMYPSFESNARESARHRNAAYYSSNSIHNSSYDFEQWYQQVCFNRCLIEYNEYWKHMFKK
ncbi:probable ATP-dependent RNA helicase DDX20 [Ischnura elegans]|uniref:probable ATP-dependent RNA helicase DDX20 n=1 Tax=Ischnura elegans TaxID=197161 RepID=UPI001ED86DEC|nr:probable ATP-dependent RNA helicase DDX20 [Ischnura elegans]